MAPTPTNRALHFFARFLREPATVGAVLPSSRQLALALAGDLGLRAGDVLFEYGPGTGPITEVIDEQLAPGVRFLAIERDPEFHARLVERFPHLDLHLGSAEDVSAIRRERNLEAPRYIVSGLPFASLPLPVQRRVVDGICDVLRPDGEFRTFQYVHAYGMAAARSFRATMQQRFEEFERSAPVLRNTPPAYVLTYRRPTGTAAPTGV